MRLIALLLWWITTWAYCGPADQVARWRNGSTDPRYSVALDKLVARYQRTQSVYKQIEAMRPNGIPAAVCFGLLYRESDNDMTCSPAQGDPLTHKSRHVPRNRIPGKEPPYTFLQAAEDSYYSPELDHMQTRNWADAGALLDAVENFNGGGYRARGLTSPYVWNGVVGPAKYRYYESGKFTGDGVFDRNFKDKQLGVAAILKRFQERNIPIPASLSLTSPTRTALQPPPPRITPPPEYAEQTSSVPTPPAESWHGKDPSPYARQLMHELEEDKSSAFMWLREFWYELTRGWQK